MAEKIKVKLNRMMWILLFLALIASVFTLIKIGFVLWFWILLIIWITIFYIKIFTVIFKVSLYFWIAFIVWFIFSFLVSFGVLFGSSSESTVSAETVNGVKVADCTSTIADTPQMLEGFKVSLFSGPTSSTNPSPSDDTGVKSFSLKKINDKTAENSLYSRTERINNMEYMSGYDTTMELCNKDNKASYYYVTKHADSPAGANTTAVEHYLHGGKYLFETGTFRIDAYIRDLSGKWHLVDRMSDITITE